MRVHPRMAALYMTLSRAFDDLIHFIFTFLMLFFVLAFASTWMFGSTNADFGGLEAACYTQFRMIVGDFGSFPAISGKIGIEDRIFLIYIAIYACVCFFVLLNFFLAIVVDAYAATKEAVVDSVVEKTLISDLYDVLTYPLFARKHGWPGRSVLCHFLFRENDDGTKWIDTDGDWTISTEELVNTGLFRPKGSVKEQRASAKSFLLYYGRMEPLKTGEDEPSHELDHVLFMRQIEQLATIERLASEKGYHMKGRGFSMIVPSLQSGFKGIIPGLGDDDDEEEPTPIVSLAVGEAGPEPSEPSTGHIL